MSYTSCISGTWIDEDIYSYYGSASSTMKPDYLTSSVENEVENEWVKQFVELRLLCCLQDEDESPKPEIINSAMSFLRILKDERNFSPPSRIVTSQDGSIIIEWQSVGCYLEAEITEPDLVEWMENKDGFDTVHYDEELMQEEYDPSGILLEAA